MASGGGVGTTGGFTVRFAVADTPPAFAEMETGVLEATATVVTVNEAIDRPLRDENGAGTEATAGFDETRSTATPPAPAGASIVTVPATGVPPTTLGAPSVRLVTSTMGSTRRLVRAEKPRSVTVIVTGVPNVRDPAVTENVALL